MWDQHDSWYLTELYCFEQNSTSSELSCLALSRIRDEEWGNEKQFPFFGQLLWFSPESSYFLQVKFLVFMTTWSLIIFDGRTANAQISLCWLQCINVYLARLNRCMKLLRAGIGFPILPIEVSLLDPVAACGRSGGEFGGISFQSWYVLEEKKGGKHKRCVLYHIWFDPDLLEKRQQED